MSYLVAEVAIAWSADSRFGSSEFARDRFRQGRRRCVECSGAIASKLTPTVESAVFRYSICYSSTHTARGRVAQSHRCCTQRHSPALENSWFLNRNNAYTLQHALDWRTPANRCANLTAQDNRCAVRSSLGRDAVAMLDLRQIPSLGYRGAHS